MGHQLIFPKLSIVFLNYNRLSETRYTLAHLTKLLKSRDDIEIIAVDNGSTDGTHEFLHAQNAQLDWLRVILLPNNIGIAGYNHGFQLAQGEYLLVLDDDSHPVDSITLDQIIHDLDKWPNIGIIACRIESSEGDAVYTWHLSPTHAADFSMAFVGCGFAIRRHLFEAIGWYPGEFFLYQNEIEVAIRVRLENYDIYYDPNCRVVHRYSLTGRTSWRRVYYPTRNTIWVIRRYFPKYQAFYLIFSRLCFGLIRALQSFQLTWYCRAVYEAFSTPIKPQILSPTLRQQFLPFFKQNSLFHQLFGRL